MIPAPFLCAPAAPGRTPSGAIEYVEEAKEKLLKRELGRPTYVLPADKRDEYEVAFRRLLELALRVDRHMSYLSLFCSEKYVDDILEIIVSTQYQEVLLAQASQEELAVHMTPSDIEHCMTLLEMASRIGRAIEGWMASEEGVRLRQTVYRAQNEMMDSFSAYINQAVLHSMSRLSSLAPLQWDLQPTPPLCPITPSLPSSPRLADLEIDGIYSYPDGREDEGMAESFWVAPPPHLFAPSTTRPPSPESSLKRSRDVELSSPCPEVAERHLPLRKRRRMSLGSEGSETGSDATFVNNADGTTMTLSDSRMGRKEVEESSRVLEAAYGSRYSWKTRAASDGAPLTPISSIRLHTDCSPPADPTLFSDPWSDSCDDETVCSADSFVTAEDVWPTDVELCDEKRRTFVVEKPPLLSSTRRTLACTVSSSVPSRPPLWRRILEGCLWIFR